MDFINPQQDLKHVFVVEQENIKIKRDKPAVKHVQQVLSVQVDQQVAHHADKENIMLNLDKRLAYKHHQDLLQLIPVKQHQLLAQKEHGHHNQANQNAPQLHLVIS